MSISIAEQQERPSSSDSMGLFSYTKWLCAALGTMLLVVILSVGLQVSSTPELFSLSRGRVLTSGTSWGGQLVKKQYEYESWLDAHGTRIERRAFNILSTILFSRAAQITENSDDMELGSDLSHRISITTLFSLLRVGFLTLAALRIWTVAILVALLSALYVSRPHRGRDILGRSKNSDRFYSGVLLDFSKADERGRPWQHFQGLASPRISSLVEVRRVPVGIALKKLQVNCESTERLAAIIHAYREMPAYIVPKEEEALLGQAVSNCSILEAVTTLLPALLRVWADLGTNVALEVSTQNKLANNGPLSITSYSEVLANELRRITPRSWRQHLSKVSPKVLALSFLGCWSGRTQAFAREGGKWVRFGSSSETAGRSILNSLPSLEGDCSPAEREQVRRIILSSYSESCPAHDNLDKNVELETAANAVHLFSCLPHELEEVSSQIELKSICNELHSGWVEAFSDAVLGQLPEVVGSSFTWRERHLLIPARTVLSIFRQSAPRSLIGRVNEILESRSNADQLASLVQEVNREDVVTRKDLLNVDPKFISQMDVKSIAEMHGMFESEVNEWGALRAVLTMNKWITNDIGADIVPCEGLLLLVLKVPTGEVVVKRGMVALRGEYLERRWGSGWHARFPRAQEMRLAHNGEDIKNLADELSN